MVEVALSFLPRSHNPSPGQQLEPRHQRKHGRQYSIQLDIGDKPVQHADSDSEAEGKSLSATGECLVVADDVENTHSSVSSSTFPQFIISL